MKRNHPSNFLIWLLILVGAFGVILSYIAFRKGHIWTETLFARGSISVFQTGIGCGLFMIVGIILSKAAWLISN